MPPFHLPQNVGKADIQSFTALTPSASVNTQTYHVPSGKTMLYIICIGAGGGGGGGRSGGAGTARGGGGGGGSGGISVLLVPIHLLPRVLYMTIRQGAAGGVADTAGGFANPSYVSFEPDGATNDVLLVSSSASSYGSGGAGTTTAGGAGGGAAGVAAVSQMPFAGLGLFRSLAGQAGTAGGDDLGAVGTSIAFPVTGLNVMGGTGGGGTTSADFAGGGITAVTSSFISEQRPEAAAGGSNNGSKGYMPQNLFFNYPGLGGAASNTGVGGRGGEGGYGCGGGGGGGGTTGGRGGDGGPGLVVMIAW